MNATIGQLKELTKRIPEGAYSAMDGFRDVLFMGRAAKVHLLGVAQLATFRAMGGAEVVECFATRVLIRFSPTAWRYLASDCGPRMAAPDHTGRGLVCRGGKARETQFLYMSEEEAAQLARSAYAANRGASVARFV